MQVATADYVVRVQDRGKDFQITTKSGQLLAEVLHAFQAFLKQFICMFVRGISGDWAAYREHLAVLNGLRRSYTQPKLSGMNTALDLSGMHTGTADKQVEPVDGVDDGGQPLRNRDPAWSGHGLRPDSLHCHR